MAYPEYEHHIHMKTYDKNAPSRDVPESELVVNFEQFDFSQGKNVKLTFIDADISHDTEMVGDMSPYIKVKVNNVEKWRSKTIKKGGKLPNFKEESVNVNLRSLDDIVNVEVWDEDMRNDDFIGSAIINSSNLVSRNGEILEYDLLYQKKSNLTSGGRIRFLADSLS